MATDPNTLLEAAKCYECAPPGEWQLFKLGLLQQILLAQNPVADTSPNALLEAAKCYACMPPGFWQLFELALLQQIASNGGTGGSSTLCGSGAPVAAPSGTCALYIDTNDGALYEFYGGAWH